MCVKPWNSGFISRVKTEDATVQFVDGTEIRGVGHHLSVTAGTGTQPGWWQAPLLQTGCTAPWPVLNRFKVHRCARGRQVESLTRPWLKTDAVLQFWCQQWVMSIGCMSDHSGFCDLSLICGEMSSWSGQWWLWLMVTFATNLSAAALRLSTGLHMAHLCTKYDNSSFFSTSRDMISNPQNRNGSCNQGCFVIWGLRLAKFSLPTT